MKALSLTQPMAWAVVAAGKDIENRSWDTKFRGRFYIHASKGFNQKHYNWIWEREGILGLTLPAPADFIHGAIIGEAELVGVCTGHSGSSWFMGPYGFMLKNAKEYEHPIYCRGQLGFFEVERTMI